MLKEVAHVLIFVSDFSKSVDFYHRTLGLKLKHREGDEWAEFVIGNMPVILQADAAKTREKTRGVVIAFHVQDIDMVYEELKRKGVLFSQAPTLQQVGSKQAIFTDPDGHTMELIGN